MTTPEEGRRRLVEGASFMLLAALAFAVLGAIVKHVSASVPPTEIVVWRSAFTGLVIALWAWRTRETLRPVNVRMHLVRGLVGVGSMFLYFTGVSRLPLGDAVLLTYSSPLIVAAMGPYMTGERTSPRTWGALATGLVGVALVVGPRGSTDWIGVLAAGAAAFFAADAYLAIRVLSRTDRPLAIVFWFSVVGTIVGSLAFLDGAAPLTPWLVAELLGTGLFGAVAQWSLTRAYSAAPAAQVSVFAYATPVFAYALGVGFGEVPTLTTLLGAAVVLLAGALAAAA